jgi:hypothetical protein
MPLLWTCELQDIVTAMPSLDAITGIANAQIGVVWNGGPRVVVSLDVKAGRRLTVCQQADEVGRLRAQRACEVVVGELCGGTGKANARVDLGILETLRRGGMPSRAPRAPRCEVLAILHEAES